MNRFVYATFAATVLALGAAAPLQAQSQSESESGLEPGDVVRVDREFVGTLMSIDRANLTVLGEGKPVCWPGIGHGEGPRCDPAPSVRRVIDWRDATVERQDADRSYTRRTIIGFLIGAAVGVPVGYVTGPSIGYGSINACVDTGAGGTQLCRNPIPREEADATQRRQDQRRGAVFVGVISATLGAIVARKTFNEWVEVRPPALVGGEREWTLGMHVPVGSQ